MGFFFFSPGHCHEGVAAHTPHQAGPRTQLLRLLLRDPQLAGPSVLAHQAGEPLLLRIFSIIATDAFRPVVLWGIIVVASKLDLYGFAAFIGFST